MHCNARPRTTSEERDAAIVALQQAVAALGRGDFDEAVGDCRPGLDLLWERDKDRYAPPNWKNNADKAERFWRVASALRTVAHAAHHPLDRPTRKSDGEGDDGDPIHFDRRDAYATIIGLAVLIMQRTGVSG